jgi:hypothetical protein
LDEVELGAEDGWMNQYVGQFVHFSYLPAESLETCLVGGGDSYEVGVDFLVLFADVTFALSPYVVYFLSN